MTTSGAFYVFVIQEPTVVAGRPMLHICSLCILQLIYISKLYITFISFVINVLGIQETTIVAGVTYAICSMLEIQILYFEDG